MNNTSRWFFFVASVSGMLSVVLGAFGTHSLKSSLSLEMVEAYKSAVQYQMFHSLALMISAWGTNRFPPKEFLLSCWSFLAGIILFSGSLYIMAFTDMRVGIVTPFGGIMFIIGWYLLGRGFWKIKSSE